MGVQLVVDLKDVNADDANNHRIHPHTEEEIVQTANSIYSMGLLQPIVIRKSNPKNTDHKCDYELVAGFGRYKALKHLADSMDESYANGVHANLIDENEVKAQIVQLVENVRRKSITQLELGRKTKSILESDKTLTQKTLCAALGIPAPTLSNIMGVMKLPEKVLELIEAYERSGDKEGLSFSAAKLLSGLKGVQEQTLVEEAVAGSGMSYGEFEEHIKKTYGANASNEDNEDVQVSSGNAGTQKTQSNAISPKNLKDKYLPKLLKDFEAATDAKSKAAQQIRIDTLNFILGEKGTQLGTELSPWEKQLETDKETNKVKDLQESARKTFIRTTFTQINKAIKQVPPALNPDGSENTNRVSPSLTEVLAMVRNGVNASMTKAKEDGKGEKMMNEGFLVGNVDELMADVGKYYKEKIESDDKTKATAAATKAAKEAQEAVAAAPVVSTPAPVVVAKKAAKKK